VHCYGHPCDVDRIQAIADTYGLKVIYDAAHAFGVKCHCGSVLTHGDLSVLSFHATKVFTTFEGGAIICGNDKIRQRINYLKNFGFADEVTVVAPGINGKMSEFNAALGLLQLQGIDQMIAKRGAIDARYRAGLKHVAGIDCVQGTHEQRRNFAYFPILVRPDYPLSRDALFEEFRAQDIYVRRYFHPLISDFPMYRGLPSAAHENLPVALKTAQQVLCLPIYTSLPDDQVDRVLDLLDRRS